MNLRIFDVEHGACALLTCDNGARLMIDAGHNATTGWAPGTHLLRQGISNLEMLAVTNFDEDHVSGIENLSSKVNVQWLYRNPSVSPAVIGKLKSADGMGPGIAHLVWLLENVYTGSGSSSEPVFEGLELKTFWNTYPTFDDENNLSLVLFLKCHGIGVLFPGDLERQGWLNLLKRDDFRAVLQSTNVLIAPHHGREGGCCEEALQYCKKLYYVVISDKGYMYDTQKTVPFYSRFAIGGPFGSETRKVLTTRKDGMISFGFSPEGWHTIAAARQALTI